MTCKKGVEHLGFLAGRDLASMFQWGISDTCSAGSGKLGCGNLALNPKPSYCHLAILPRGCIDMVCVYIHIYIYMVPPPRNPHPQALLQVRSSSAWSSSSLLPLVFVLFA